MKLLNKLDVEHVSGGEFVPGWPTPEMLCLDVKLMVAAGRGEAAFDITSAVHSLLKYCPLDFNDPNVAHEYAVSGAIP